MSFKSLIAGKLGDGVAIPWEEAMRLALYDAEFGFYAKAGRVGKGGDFYTSVSVGTLFGRLLADWAAARLGELDGPVSVIEAGADEGWLAGDVLDRWKSGHPQLYERVTYHILEPREASRAAQSTRLVAHEGKVRWGVDLEGMADRSVRGIIWSNELLDAFPVEVWRWNAGFGFWRKQGVRKVSEALAWADVEGFTMTPEQMGSFAEGLAGVLPDGFQIERQESAREWWALAARKLEAGWLLAGDYGESESYFWQPERCHGTLRGYRGHRVCDPLEAVDGETDLTTTVHFDLIAEVGCAEGLRTEYYGPQSRFLVEQVQRGGMELGPKEAGELLTLTRPDQLGQKFKILAQRRDFTVL